MGVLSIKQVSKSFKSYKVLNSVNLEVKNGVYGLLGPNGAGKTTLMRIIATLMLPDCGEIHFNDIDCLKNPALIRQTLGYLPQEFGCFGNINAVECLDYIGILKGIYDKKEREDNIQNVLMEVNLLEHSKKKIKHYSGGMRRRLGIAQAILGNPNLLMVDEPTAGLDPEERIRFRVMLRRLAQNRTVLLSTHIVEDIKSTCDGIAVLNKGVLSQFSSLDELAVVAKNKVWKFYIQEKDYEQKLKEFKVISTTATLNGIELRVLSNVCPNNDAELVIPSFEEGYLAWIKS